MSHPTYSPNFTLSDFCLFPQMKKAPKGKYFSDVEGVKQKIAEALRGIKIDEFKNCSEQWEKNASNQTESALKVTEV